MAFHLFCGAIFLYWEETAPNVVHRMYDKMCTRTLPWPTTILCIQFSCWVEVYALNFELVLEEVENKMNAAKQTNSEWLSYYTLPKLKYELKMVMRLKQAIIDTYGSSIIFNQLYTFICLLLNCTLLTYAEYIKRSKENA